MTDWTLPPLPPIQRTEIDGIPTLWMDEPGPMVGMLLFRVGRCDEPTPIGGVSHIVEHLALAALVSMGRDLEDDRNARPEAEGQDGAIGGDDALDVHFPEPR